MVMSGNSEEDSGRYHFRDRSKTRALIRSQAQAERERETRPTESSSSSSSSSGAPPPSNNTYLQYHSNMMTGKTVITHTPVGVPKLLPSSARPSAAPAPNIAIPSNPLLSMTSLPAQQLHQSVYQQQPQQYLYIGPSGLQMNALPSVNPSSLNVNSLRQVTSVNQMAARPQVTLGMHGAAAGGLAHGGVYHGGNTTVQQQAGHQQQQSMHQLPNHYAPALPIHPDVRFAPHAFYDLLSELHRTTTLLCQNLSSRGQEQTYTFHLSPVQAERIGTNRKKNFVTGKAEYQVQVQLRFAKLIATSDQEDNFPPLVSVKVNRTAITLPPAIPTNKAGQDPKRPGRPLNITGQCRISPTVPNNVAVAWGHDNAQNYCAGIFLVAKLTPDDLIQRMIKKGIKPAEFSKSMMKEKMSSEDLEVAVTDLHASLLCPLGKCRMRTPTRGTSCKHLQCFDAFTYLAMNEKKPTWKCPFCDGPAHYTALYIDGLFKDILEKAAFGVDKVQFSQDGSWSAVDENADATSAESAQSTSAPAPSTSANSASMASSDAADKAEDAVTVDLTCSDDEDEDAGCVPKGAAVSKQEVGETAPPTLPPISNSPEIICLDDSDDDEEDEPSQPSSPSASTNKRPLSISPEAPTVDSGAPGGPPVAKRPTTDNGQNSPRFVDLPPPSAGSSRHNLGHVDWNV